MGRVSLATLRKDKFASVLKTSRIELSGAQVEGDMIRRVGREKVGFSREKMRGCKLDFLLLRQQGGMCDSWKTHESQCRAFSRRYNHSCLFGLE